MLIALHIFLCFKYHVVRIAYILSVHANIVLAVVTSKIIFNVKLFSSDQLYNPTGMYCTFNMLYGGKNLVWYVVKQEYLGLPGLIVLYLSLQSAKTMHAMLQNACFLGT